MEMYSFLWLRSLLSAVFLFALMASWKSTLSVPKQSLDFWLNTALIGLLYFFVYNGIFRTTAGRAALFYYTQPITLTVLAIFFLPDEKASLRVILGIAAAIFGLLFVLSEKLFSGNTPTWRGDVWVFLAATTWAVQALHLKMRLPKTNPFLLTAWSQLVTVPPFLVISLWLGESAPDFGRWEVFAGFIYNGLVGTGLALVLYMKLIALYSATRVSAFMFLTPVFGVFIGVLLLSEPVSLLMVAGVGLVAVGIYMVNTKC